MEHWSSFIYLYGIGGFLFALAIFMGFKKGVINLKRRTDRFVFSGFVAVYLIYFSAQGFWNYLAVTSNQ